MASKSKDKQVQQYNPIQLCTVEGNLAELARLVNSGTEPDHWKDGRSETPLILAIEHNHLDCAKFLLDKGANANHQIKYKDSTDKHYRSKYKKNWTPLHFAARKANYEAIEMLIKADADLQPKTERLPLNVLMGSGASEEDIVKCMNLMLEHGADINNIGEDEDECGNMFGTPLHIVCEKESSATLIRELFKHGADGKNIQWQVPAPPVCILQGMRKNGTEEWMNNFKAFIECYGFDCEITFEFRIGGKSKAIFKTQVLYAAVFYALPEVVKYLIDMGASTDVPIEFIEDEYYDVYKPWALSADEIDLLCAVLHNGHIDELREERCEIMELLLKNGCDPNEPRFYSIKFEDLPCSVLQYCTYSQRLEMIKVLLKYGANPNNWINDRNCITFSSWPGACMDHGLGPQCLEEMLKAGLDPNLTNEYDEKGISAVLVDNQCAENCGLIGILQSAWKRDYTAGWRIACMREDPSGEMWKEVKALRDKPTDEHDEDSNSDEESDEENRCSKDWEKIVNGLPGTESVNKIDNPFRVNFGCNTSRCLKLLLKYGAYEDQDTLMIALEAMLCIRSKHPFGDMNENIALCSINKSNVLLAAGLISRAMHARVCNYYMGPCGYENVSEDWINAVMTLRELSRRVVVSNMKKRDEAAFDSLKLPVHMKSAMCFRNMEEDSFEELDLKEYMSQFSKKKKDSQDAPDFMALLRGVLMGEKGEQDEWMKDNPMVRVRKTEEEGMFF